MPDKEPLPLRHPWSFRHLETGEVREYEQRELSIDGEVQLFSLITRSIERLGTDFPWDSEHHRYALIAGRHSGAGARVGGRRGVPRHLPDRYAGPA
jgi:hypothetical protein